MARENGKKAKQLRRFLTDSAGTLVESRIDVRATRCEPEMGLVKVYPGVRYQRIIGFGAALTEASGFVFAQMPDDEKIHFAELCFGEQGNQYSLARLSIQSCDFSLGPRAYLARKPKSQAGLAGFSIADDNHYIIPLVKVAIAANPGLEFLASPWSPPAWAKTNRSMKRGGRLKPECYGIWAQMIAHALVEYQRNGIRIGRITMQNEPKAVQTWESCLFSADEEREFLHRHLRPALREAGLSDVRVLAWDHNKERLLDRASAIMADPASAADLDGMAFHWYSGDHFEAVRATRELIGARRELIFTEGCEGYSAGNAARELPHAEHYAHEIIGDLEAGANGIIDWNILLDQHGGPNHVGNYCDAPIMYDTSARKLNVRLPFHYLGHFSRFILPDAQRILCTRHTTALETTAFRNPDGSLVLVALNRTDRGIRFTLTSDAGALAKRVASVEAPPHSIQTLVWR